MAYEAPANQQKRPTVFLGMPAYSGATPGAMRALYQYAGRNLNIHIAESYSSLLAHSFNSLWCGFATLLEHGEHVDYFAMLHSDVEPMPPSSPHDQPWLNVMIDELERTGADVLSVVIPIKDNRGMTSTAVAGDDKWFPLFRLTMKQIMALPETFTAADVGHPDRALLVNTGCWIAKVGPWVFDFPGFMICDRVRREQMPASALYQWRPDVCPEDWGASQWWHDNGLKVMATRKVVVNHVGKASYGNNAAWGDSAWDADLDAAGAAESLTRRLHKSER